MSITQQEQIDQLMNRVTELVMAVDLLAQQCDAAAVTTHNTSETSHPDVRRTLTEIRSEVTAGDTANKNYVDRQITTVNQSINSVQTAVGNFASGSTTVKKAESATSATTATKANNNINGYALADTIVKNVVIGDNGVLTITKIDGKTYTVTIKSATTTTNGLMAKADKVKLDKWDGNFVSNNEVTQMAKTAWAAGKASTDNCWNTDVWVKPTNTWCKDNNIPDNIEGSGQEPNGTPSGTPS